MNSTHKSKTASPRSVQRVVSRLEAVMRAGQMCSNCCYNLAQARSGDNDKALRESYEAWDAASTAMRKDEAERRGGTAVQVIHKIRPTWGETQCGKYLWPARGALKTSYRWRNVTCKDCLKDKPK